MARVLQVSSRMTPVQLPVWQVQRINEAIDAHNAQQVERFEAMARIRRAEMLELAGDYAARSALGMAYGYRVDRLKAEAKEVAAWCVAMVALIVAVVGR